MNESHHDKATVFERFPRLTILALAGISFVLLDLMVTFVTQVAGVAPQATPAADGEPDPNQGYRQRSDIYHHDLLANVASDSANWGQLKYSVYTDSLGFKSDRVKSTPLLSERYRILFIGDSFTEGIGYEYDETFVGRIANALSGEGIDVLNAGVSSYSPIIYWRKIKYLLEDVGLDVDEVIVFLDISDIQDEAIIWRLADDGTVIDIVGEQPVEQMQQKEGLKGLMKRRLMFSYFLLNEVHDLIFPASDYYVDQDRSLWTIDPKLMQAWGQDGLERAAASMSKLAELLRSRGIPLTVAVYPWPDQVAKNDLESIQASYWRDWAGQHGTGFLNYFPCFVTGDVREVLDNYYILRDSHWNAAGHRLVADEFVSTYRRALAERKQSAQRDSRNAINASLSVCDKAS
ncbi:MAG: hypothetical protein HKN56_07000 [Gammaproteobacteria bacterium]|nr:hypothetical protein [Gammaproteobacteria bacterium]NND54701.1 hypothetical protein [Gammaproteobacteria bacterium]